MHLETLQADLINTTAALADASLQPVSERMTQEIAALLELAQVQLKALQEAIPSGNVVQMP
ncbi:MAG: hypothetical protein ABJN05_04690 [Sulfitobacter dubius]